MKPSKMTIVTSSPRMTLELLIGHGHRLAACIVAMIELHSLQTMSAAS